MPVASPVGSTISVGRQGRLNINAKTLCFTKAIPMSTREIVANLENVICGDIDPPIQRMQKGREIVGWQFEFDFTWPILEVWLPLLGITNLGSNVFELGATDLAVAFPVQVDLRGALHDIDAAYVTKWAFRGSKGSRPSSLSVEIIGSQETEGTTFTPDKVAYGDMFSFTHSSMTLENGAGSDIARAFDRFLIQVDNKLVAEHNNSVFVTDATIGDRQAVLATSVPYVAAHDDLYWDYKDDEDGKKSVVTLDNGTKSVAFLMPTGMAVAKPGSITGMADQIRTPITLLLGRSDNVGTRVSPLKITVINSP